MSRTISIPPEVRDWLATAGFTNHCFMSYPHSEHGNGAREMAERVRQGILEELHNAGADPSVFIDRSAPPGTEWPDLLQQNLSHSVAMVAILSPAYFRHDWCGREWAAMSTLGKHRHPNTSLTPIIPALYRTMSELPGNTGELQLVDFSRVALSGPRYYTVKEFRANILRITLQIIEIANQLCANRCTAGQVPGGFPPVSPFNNSPPQAPPMRMS